MTDPIGAPSIGPGRGPVTPAGAGIAALPGGTTSDREVLEGDVFPRRSGDPCVMVIFGASGDLTKRKLIPALHNLARQNLLAQEFAVVGFARPGMSTEEFRAKIGEEMPRYATGPVTTSAAARAPDTSGCSTTA